MHPGMGGREDGVQLGRKAKILRDTAIGAGTVVEDGAEVRVGVFCCPALPGRAALLGHELSGRNVQCVA